DAAGTCASGISDVVLVLSGPPAVETFGLGCHAAVASGGWLASAAITCSGVHMSVFSNASPDALPVGAAGASAMTVASPTAGAAVRTPSTWHRNMPSPHL